jgi:hypothetical protein
MTPYEVTMRKILVILLLGGVFLAVPRTGAAGQKPKAQAGEEVIVTHAGSGQELRGRIVELSPTSLAILVQGRRVEVPVTDVLRIDARTDSVKNGAIIGAIVMGGLGLLACADVDEGAVCAALAIEGVGLGALAGAGIDALHKGRTPIYIKPAKSGAAVGTKIRF